MKVYAVCPISQEPCCGHSKPDAIFLSFNDADKYVFEEYGYKQESHYTYDDDPNYTAAWYYTPDGVDDDDSNVVIIEYIVK